MLKTLVSIRGSHLNGGSSYSVYLPRFLAAEKRVFSKINARVWL